MIEKILIGFFVYWTVLFLFWITTDTVSSTTRPKVYFYLYKKTEKNLLGWMEADVDFAITFTENPFSDKFMKNLKDNDKNIRIY
jgi:hypothetical protein